MKYLQFVVFISSILRKIDRVLPMISFWITLNFILYHKIQCQICAWSKETFFKKVVKIYRYPHQWINSVSLVKKMIKMESFM